MNTNEITNLIERFAPLETQEDWDNSGWQVYYEKNVNKILLCLSITEKIVKQAIEKNCDMIISHHPFIFPTFIPFNINQKIPIYSAHTNLDKANGGTTDTLIEVLFSGLNQTFFDGEIVIPPYISDSSSILNSNFMGAQKVGDFLRLVELKNPIPLNIFADNIKQKLDMQTLRIVNNLNKKELKKIAFCAGSGAEFINEAELNGADAIVTGDVKYHTALESNVIIIDVGHFESEHPILKKLQSLLKNVGIEAIIADEKSPFINY